jgi:large subunit ribosomal protein L25
MAMELKGEIREPHGTGAARETRRRGLIPAVCYGGGKQPLHLSLDPKEFVRLLQTKRGRNAVFELTFDDKTTHHVMVQDVQRDPVKRVPIHVDFRLVKDDERIVVEVPLTIQGKSKAEELGGRPNLTRRTVEIACQVRDIPDEILHDVSELNMGAMVRASELSLPPGCEVVYKTDYVVISVHAPRGAEEATAEEEEKAAEAVPAAPAA